MSPPIYGDGSDIFARPVERIYISGVDVTEDATPVELRCPFCNSAVLRYPWWDDPEDKGGAVIGDYLRCITDDWDEFR